MVYWYRKCTIISCILYWPNNECKSTMYLFLSRGGTCKLPGYTWSHGSWMVETGSRVTNPDPSLLSGQGHELSNYSWDPTISLSLLSQAVRKPHLPPARYGRTRIQIDFNAGTPATGTRQSLPFVPVSPEVSFVNFASKPRRTKAASRLTKDKSGWYVEPSVLEDTQNLVYGPYLAIPQFHSRSALASYSRSGPYTAHLLAGIFFPVTIK